MFELKKLISVFITIPGIFIVFLIVTGIYGFRKKIFVLKFNLFIGIVLYFVSISFAANHLIGFVEKENVYSGKPAVDAMILLGAGTVEGVPDISGISIPSYDMTVRIVDAVRLYRKYKLPILFTGGSLPGRVKESVIVKRYLVDLGVKEKDILLEESSRDTIENALYTKEIFNKKGFKKGLLVTSAYHIRRSEFLFKKAGLDVYPHSCGILSDKSTKINLFDFLPGINNLDKTAITIKETVGLLFYYIKYEIF